MDILEEAPVIESPDAPALPGTIRVILADSQSIYRVGIRRILALEDDIQLVAQADSLEQLYVALEKHSADLVLIESDLLARNPASVAELLRIAPNVKLIAQTVAVDESQTVDFFRRGIRGIISRAISPDLLIRCLRRIAAGEAWIDHESLKWVIKAYRADDGALQNPRAEFRLSPKERAIITCITQGKRNKEIAFQLGTSEQVIKNYLRKIYDKLGVADRLELAMYSLQKKLVKPDANQPEPYLTARQNA